MIIRGDSVAAYCCGHLLNQSGFRIDFEAQERARLPVILLGDQALALIRDIFDQPLLFANAARISKRVVSWSLGATPMVLEHSAIIVSEETLLAALRPDGTSPGTVDTAWTIVSSRPLPSPTEDHCFGARTATAVRVNLRNTTDPETCWIEALEGGWLFLTPGWLLAVGAQPEALLARSRVVAPEIARGDEPRGSFPAYPRIAAPICAPGWLACGTAAMAFDPICGDGTANAIREAILASAVIRALVAGGSVEDLLSHYRARLIAGFQRHLKLCRNFYQSGGITNWWAGELEATDRGIQWCDAQLANHTDFRYRLRDLELEAVRWPPKSFVTE